MTGDSPGPLPPHPAWREGYRQGFMDGFESYRTMIGRGGESDLAPTPLSVPASSPPPGWIPLRHTGNGTPAHLRSDDADLPCGNVSHYLTDRVLYKSPANIEMLRKLDGTMPDPSEIPVCGSCNARIDPWSSAYLDYSDAFIPSTVPSKPVPSSHPDPVDEITRALAELEASTVESSVPSPPPAICGRCGEDAHGPCPAP